ncbi:MAG: hypothetical protein KAT00_11675 [Planctomycetes bacterium]|nr:hypothetical protein [Planctomycetota bacterium]
MTIDTLIDKEDNFEVVRTQIAAILALNTAKQQVLAAAAAEDPELWAFNVYEERSTPWEAIFNESTGSVEDETPIVNVWYDTGNFPGDKGDTVERQMHDAVYNIDIYAAAVSRNDRTGAGYTPGDLQASLNVQRVLRLVRNILMAGENTYLQLRGLVWQRWIQSINAFQPQLSDRPAVHIIAARIAFNVKFNEFSPQATPEDLETLFATIKRESDGKVVALAEYDLT